MSPFVEVILLSVVNVLPPEITPVVVIVLHVVYAETVILETLIVPFELLPLSNTASKVLLANCIPDIKFKFVPSEYAK